jgi:hydroxylamine reductase
MFCYQCQEAAKGTGCTIRGTCGKTGDTAKLQDLLIYTLKGISIYCVKARAAGIEDHRANQFIVESLFSTITNANFDDRVFTEKIKEGLELREEIKEKLLKNTGAAEQNLHDAALWNAQTLEDFYQKAEKVGVLSTGNEDIRSLRELLIYGVKGMAAYVEHAHVLGYGDDRLHAFIQKALAATTDDAKSVAQLVAMVMECGKYGVDAMALLDKANTTTYGNPEVTQVNIGVRQNPGILVSGHDLKDFEELLIQTEGAGVDVYTHGEMLPANYYPAFKKYKHFVGNYGNAWWQQGKEFEAFNGPVLITTNCLVPPKGTYKDRVYTTGVVGFEGVNHIANRTDGKPKDFSAVIEHAKACTPPTEIERGAITGGFAHNTMLGLADRIVDAVKKGAVKRFFVMAGCDGRSKDRDYYTEFARKLPENTVILTAGCAKYRYNKLDLGYINGIPRVLDAGQCNDSYSLVLTALKLKEAFGMEDINELPVSYNIAWYEQKAVIVLLALLYLGVKNIHLGPTLPAFLSPNVAKVLVDSFGIGGISDVEQDMEMFMG